MKPAIYRYKEIDEVDLAKLLTALGNSDGGIIEIEGGWSQEIIENSINYIDPKPGVFVKKEEGLLKLFVSPSSDKPYVMDGVVYIIREGKIKKALSHDIKNLIERKERFNDSLLMDEDISTIDFSLLDELLRMKAIKSWPEKFLRETGLVIGNQPTIACILLFSKRERPEHFSLQLKIDKTLIPNAKDFPDEVGGNIFQLYRRAKNFLEEISSKFMEGKDIEKFCRIINEALLNSLIHRDIFSKAPNLIHVGRNEILIWNPGESLLPLEDMRVPHPSLRRNPLIYRAFSLLIDKIEGIGTIEIFELSKELSVIPSYELKWGGTLLKISLERVAKRELNDRQIVFLEYLREKGSATRKDYERLTGVKERTARLDIEELLELGFIERGGKGRNIYYKLKIT